MMSHQQLFEPILTGEPPARDTLDALVRRSRRRQRYRRLTATGVGLVAAGVVTVLALPSTPPLVTGAPPTTAPSSPSRADPVLLGEDPTERPEDAVQRLAVAVPSAVTQVVPAARTVVQPTVRREVVMTLPDNVPLTSAYVVTSVITVNGVPGTLVVTVQRRYVALGCAAAFPADVLPSTLRTQCAPNADVGQPYTIETKRDERPGMIRNVVSLDRLDGLTVTVSVSNEPALTGAPPLTGEQIVEIARDPQLTLYP
ncbi:hypothetical protein [Dactylosporangium cerinum]